MTYVLQLAAIAGHLTLASFILSARSRRTCVPAFCGIGVIEGENLHSLRPGSIVSPEKPEKKGNQFVIPSLNGKIYLLNMLIINSLNRKNANKCPF